MNDMGAMTGALLCGHGSRDEEARTEFERFIAATRKTLLVRESTMAIEGAYLEFLHPTIDEGFTKLAHAGANRILAQPLMLFAAKHAKKDVPGEAAAFAASHPSLRIDCGHELTLNAKLIAAAGDRVDEVEALAKSTVRRSDTLLLVIGRGSSDQEANRTLTDLSAKLHESLGIAEAGIAYAGIAGPSIADMLAEAARRKYPRVIVLPYFLFTGVLVKRIRALTEETARRYPAIQFLVARHLSDHPLVVETVVDRIVESTHAG
jgi:sirohydrochlorin cobaltochelatase